MALTISRLIIDDEKTFTRLGSEGIEYARSCREGLTRLQQRGAYWDEVWLDFDLGDRDATPIINYLEEIRATQPFAEPICETIISCSMNPPGRQTIRLVLGRYYEIVEILPWEYL